LPAEALRRSGEIAALRSLRIFATDLDEHAIAYARRGFYSAESIRQLPSAWIDRYFTRQGQMYEVGKTIRDMTC
jgi:chemotaxis methyl-accepting protein methylase